MKKYNMCKREGIFFGILILWFLAAIVEIFIFPTFAAKYGTLVSLIPIGIMFFAIVPRHFSSKYNNWLESDLFKKK